MTYHISDSRYIIRIDSLNFSFLIIQQCRMDRRLRPLTLDRRALEQGQECLKNHRVVYSRGKGFFSSSRFPSAKGPAERRKVSYDKEKP